MTPHRLASLAALCALPLIAVALGGCDPPVSCTTEARASVQVTVLDDAGASVSGVAVTMTPAGDSESACDAAVGGGSDTFVCGFEVSGDITVRATAPGFAAAEQTVNVGETDDGCHVVTEQVDLTLTPQ